ncbi:response regulator [Anaeromyxobacter oryzisoli]|jgi:two-component system, chemotaxis family, chemotaxis protein CheY|uniref:response regulator n=1 Tax=Anaeromyxobacter oryzisoli TaxID=2925408 RepID=UPI001F5603D9|nr:response regulator [Anaeromyxobacter sp. SG63]
MSQHLHALVVDDSSALRKQLCHALRRIAGLTTTEATDGADAWRKLSAGTFDLVLTDVNMPVLDGLKLVALIRSGGPHRRVPILVITTEGAEADQRRAMNAGASAYLMKPVQAQQVAEAVRGLLRLE